MTIQQANASKRPLTDAERELLAWLDRQAPFLPDCVTHEAMPIGPAGVRWVERKTTEHLPENQR